LLRAAERKPAASLVEPYSPFLGLLAAIERGYYCVLIVEFIGATLTLGGEFFK